MSSPPAEIAGVFTSRRWGSVSTLYLFVASAATVIEFRRTVEPPLRRAGPFVLFWAFLKRIT